MQNNELNEDSLPKYNSAEPTHDTFLDTSSDQTQRVGPKARVSSEINRLQAIAAMMAMSEASMQGARAMPFFDAGTVVGWQKQPIKRYTKAPKLPKYLKKTKQKVSAKSKRIKRSK